MMQSKKSKGMINTKKLMTRIKKLNTLFDNDDHHDSHEFLSWLLNEVHENLMADAREGVKDRPIKSSWVTDLFEGKLVSMTKCLSCESGGSREESFLALSLNIERSTSISNCIKQFSHKELMSKRDKFYCENCQTKQVATR